MPKYIENMEIVDAVQVLKPSDLESEEWVKDAVENGTIEVTTSGYLVLTPIGMCIAKWGDYVVRGVRGIKACIFALEKDEFESSYSPAVPNENITVFSRFDISKASWLMLANGKTSLAGAAFELNADEGYLRDKVEEGRFFVEEFAKFADLCGYDVVLQKRETAE